MAVAARAALLGVLALLLEGCGHDKSTTDPNLGHPAPPGTSQTTSAAPAGDGDRQSGNSPDVAVGSPVQSGYTVYLRAATGNYLDCEGAFVQARWSDQGPPGSYQTFTIERVTGEGAISSGDQIFLVASSGKRLAVQGSAVMAQSNIGPDFQALTIEKDAGGPVFYGDTIYLLAQTGRYIDVENTAVQAWSRSGSQREFVLEFRGMPNSGGQLFPGSGKEEQGSPSTTPSDGATDSSSTTSEPGAPTVPPAMLDDRMPASFEELHAVRNCYLAAPLTSVYGCQKLAPAISGENFTLNQFGQDTTAKHRCREAMLKLNADTFVFEVGKCELWNCSSAASLKASANPVEGASARISLRDFHGHYFAVKPDTQEVLATSADGLEPESQFAFHEGSDGHVSLQGSSGSFVQVLPDGRLVASASDASDPAASFLLIRHPDGTVSFQTDAGKYVTAQTDGWVAGIAYTVDDWEKFTIVNHSAAVADSEATSDMSADAEIYSTLCEYEEGTGGRGGASMRAPIFVKLWEWNYGDIAKECEEYLGPNGFDAVQISPVTEHTTGSQWWVKYQPVSFGLNSRSGGAEELRDMVSRCRAAGVKVIVDLVINHIASPCAEAEAEGADDSALPCAGWNGSRYGRRRTGGARGWDSSTPQDFHHNGLGPMENCGVSAPSYLCGSPDIRDCSCCTCDLYGLPDWDTGSQRVRAMHFKHVRELHDMGVTMLRIDASLYTSVPDLSSVLNRFPWDYVYQEWWGEYPVEARGEYIGNYRDVAYRWKICDGLANHEDLNDLPDLLKLDFGTNGLKAEDSVYPMAYHDGRTDNPDQGTATYKNGLEYHQQQKFLMAWPKSVRILIWGGFGWWDVNQGPPGCEFGDKRCTVQPVFDAASGVPSCMPTPSQSPLPEDEVSKRSWVCEHRWEGIAGLVGFRKACRGLPVTHITDGQAEAGSGRLAFRIGDGCFVALVRGHNVANPQPWGPLGDWSMQGLSTGLPSGRYCDVASLTTTKDWDRQACPRTVTIDSAGRVVAGTVRQGDLLAIYAGAKLPEQRRLRASGAPSDMEV